MGVKIVILTIIGDLTRDKCSCFVALRRLSFDYFIVGLSRMFIRLKIIARCEIKVLTLGSI